jgi:hypothetical protein
MLRNWKTLVPVLALTLVGAPSVRAQEFTGADRTQEKLDLILKGLSSIEVRMGIQDAAIKSLLERVERLERENAELKKQMQANEQRVSKYLEPTARNSIVRLENRSPYPATIYVNDRSYPLGPYQSADVPGMPAGTFTYEVHVEGFGIRQPRVTRILGQREIFTIYVNP